MGEVIALRKEPEEPEIPHLVGAATCLACQHKWVAVSPVPMVAMFECPSCHLEKGTYDREFVRDDPIWHCDCGCFYFTVTARGVYCPNCAKWQEFSW